MESARSEAPAQNGAQVLGAEIDFQGCVGLQREGQEADATQPPAGGTGLLFGRFAQRRGRAEDQLLLAFRAVGLAGNPVPIALGALAAAARHDLGATLTRGDPQAVHSSVSRSRLAAVSLVAHAGLPGRAALSSIRLVELWSAIKLDRRKGNLHGRRTR